MTTLYPEQRFISYATGKPNGTAKGQSVIVSCDESVRDQIAIIIEHFDRKNTVASIPKGEARRRASEPFT